jgi:hypothetical protein
MTQAIAYAMAILDNAQEDNQPIPLELVDSFNADFIKIIGILHEAHHLSNRP